MKTETPSVKIVAITADEAGQRIDNFLRTQLKGVPKSMIYRILRKGEVRVNKKRIKPEYKLEAGDEVRIPPVRVAEREEEAVSPHLQKVAALADVILYEDDHILVLNKPSGTAVHGGSGLSFGVIEGLRALRPEARFLELVHRLDRDTSGVLLVAKNARRCVLCMSNYVKKGCKRLPGAGARSVAVACEERSSTVTEKYSAKRRTYRACESGRQTVGNTL